MAYYTRLIVGCLATEVWSTLCISQWFLAIMKAKQERVVLSVTVRKNERIGIFHPIVQTRAATNVNGTSYEPQGVCIDETKRAKAFQLMTEGIPEIGPQDGKELRALLEEFVDVISLDTDDIGQTTLVQHQINTGDATPVRLPPRQLPFHQRGEVKQLLDKN